jgi:hypothetical protein
MNSGGSSGDGSDGIKVAEIFVPCIVGPILIAILIYCIVKMKKNRDKLRINTDLLKAD